jgi:hypothetical protein
MLFKQKGNIKTTFVICTVKNRAGIIQDISEELKKYRFMNCPYSVKLVPIFFLFVLQRS